MAPTRPTIPVTSIGDPRIAIYRNLKDRDLSREGTGRFIAEGELVVRRLLDSDFACESVLLATRRVEEIDRKSTRLNSSHLVISYAVFCLKKKNRQNQS